MDRSSKQKIKKETIALNDILGLMDLTDIFRSFHPKIAEYTLFSSAHETFPRIDHILGCKTELNPESSSSRSRGSRRMNGVGEKVKIKQN